MSGNAQRFRRNKYGAKKTQCAHGHNHDSKKEAGYCDLLHFRWQSGEIDNLKVHHQFWFVIDGVPLKHKNGRRVGYLSDFMFVENGRKIVVDVKGFAARDWPLRRAVFIALFPDIELREV